MLEFNAIPLRHMQYLNPLRYNTICTLRTYMTPVASSIEKAGVSCQWSLLDTEGGATTVGKGACSGLLRLLNDGDRERSVPSFKGRDSNLFCWSNLNTFEFNFILYSTDSSIPWTLSTFIGSDFNLRGSVFARFSMLSCWDCGDDSILWDL